MNFMLYDTSCDHLKDGLIRGFYFLGELFIYGFAITLILNILNERKIEKQNFVKRCLKFSLIHIGIFLLLYIICSINELKYCNLI